MFVKKKKTVVCFSTDCKTKKSDKNKYISRDLDICRKHWKLFGSDFAKKEIDSFLQKWACPIVRHPSGRMTVHTTVGSNPDIVWRKCPYLLEHAMKEWSK